MKVRLKRGHFTAIFILREKASRRVYSRDSAEAAGPAQVKGEEEWNGYIC